MHLTHSLTADSLRGKLLLDKRTHRADRSRTLKNHKYLLLYRSDDGIIQNIEKQGACCIGHFLLLKEQVDLSCAVKPVIAGGSVSSHRMMGGLKKDGLAERLCYGIAPPQTRGGLKPA